MKVKIIKTVLLVAIAIRMVYLIKILVDAIQTERSINRTYKAMEEFENRPTPPWAQKLYQQARYTNEELS